MIDKVIQIYENIKKYKPESKLTFKEYGERFGVKFINSGKARAFYRCGKIGYKVSLNRIFEENQLEYQTYKQLANTPYKHYFPNVYNQYLDFAVIEVEYIKGISLIDLKDYHFDKYYAFLDRLDAIVSEISYQTGIRPCDFKSDRNVLVNTRTMEFKFVDYV